MAMLYPKDSIHPYLLALIFFSPFLCCGASLQARDDINIPFMADHSIDAYSQHFD